MTPGPRPRRKWPEKKRQRPLHPLKTFGHLEFMLRERWSYACVSIRPSSGWDIAGLDQPDPPSLSEHCGGLCARVLDTVNTQVS